MLWLGTMIAVGFVPSSRPPFSGAEWKVHSACNPPIRHVFREAFRRPATFWARLAYAVPESGVLGDARARWPL